MLNKGGAKLAAFDPAYQDEALPRNRK